MRSSKHSINQASKHFSIILIIILIFLICFDSFSQPTARCVKVLRVIDGDTFVLITGEKVRLLGIDTPELDSKDSKESAHANEARELTKGYAEDKIIKLTFEGKLKDIFGRTLAYVWLTNKEGRDSLFIQAELLKSGLARILMYPKNKMYYHLFYNLRNTARKNRLGIWSK